jgi:hypothetical protein
MSCSGLVSSLTGERRRISRLLVAATRHCMTQPYYATPQSFVGWSRGSPQACVGVLSPRMTVEATRRGLDDDRS